MKEYNIQRLSDLPIMKQPFSAEQETELGLDYKTTGTPAIKL